MKKEKKCDIVSGQTRNIFLNLTFISPFLLFKWKLSKRTQLRGKALKKSIACNIHFNLSNKILIPIKVKVSFSE